MNKKVIGYVILGILILGLIFFTLFPGMIYAVKDFGNSGNSENKCTSAPGYDAISWKEHMSHHPNIYKDCLQ